MIPFNQNMISNNGEVYDRERGRERWRGRGRGRGRGGGTGRGRGRGRGGMIMNEEFKEELFENNRLFQRGDRRGKRGGFFNSRNQKNPYYVTNENIDNMLAMGLENLLQYMQSLEPWKERIEKTRTIGKHIESIVEILAKVCQSEGEGIFYVRDCFEASNFRTELNIKLRDISSVLSPANNLNGIPKIILNLSKIYKTSIKYFRSDLRYFDPKDILECIEMIKMINKNKISNRLETIYLEFKDIHTEIKKIQLDFVTKEIEQKSNQVNLVERNIKITYTSEHCHPSYEEIMNPRRKNIIFPHLIQGPYQSLELYLNNMFYLLKEDFVSGLRNGISQFKRGEVLENAYFYDDVQIGSLNFKEYAVSIFLSLHPVALKKNNKPHAINWKSTKRLTFGGLMALTNRTLDDLYFVTIHDKPDANILTKEYEQTGYCTISVKGMEDFDKEMDTRLREMAADGGLIAFECRTFYEAYSHCLDRIKNFNLEDFPFVEQIISCRFQKNLPLYLENSNKLIFLNTNLNDFKKDLLGKYNLNLLSSEWSNALKGTLDNSQYNALKTILTNEMAIIQGPPGTGKTFVGALAVKILLENSHVWREGRRRPITILAYTNHALDQFLGHISKFTKSIARLGGRCTDPTIKNFSLNELRNEWRKVGKGNIKDYRNLKETMDEIRNIYSNFDPNRNFTWTDFIDFIPSHISEKFKYETEKLLENCNLFFGKSLGYRTLNFAFNAWASNEELNQKFFEEILYYEEERENFEVDRNQKINEKKALSLRKKPKEEIKLEESEEEDEIEDPFEEENRRLELNIENEEEIFKNNSNLGLYNDAIFDGEFDTLIEEDFYSDTNFWEMDQYQKSQLIKFFKSQLKEKYKEKYEECIERYKVYQENVIKQGIERDLQILGSKKIVGMTITGSAKYAAHLDGLESPITIIEEAAEVLESHTISVLTKHTQHLILIGDHQQLRPKIEDFGLEKNFHFNISMFERMVNNGINFAKLEHQRRMRPCFADFIRIIYDAVEYKDHQSVLSYPSIMGIRGDLIFFNHKQLESENQGLKSKTNEFEANMIVNLTDYFIKQNYKPEQITILAMYVGQTLKIKTLLKQMKIDVRVATVDNYQGEENDIIIVSLVRSNKENKLGFTKDPNRICVSLSRARKGLYIFGNFDCLKMGVKGSDLWKKIIALAEEKKVLTNRIILACQNHKNICEITNVQSFKNVPEGGCILICNIRKECGHTCKLHCHNTEEHLRKQCHEICNNINPNCGHKCPKKCKEECGRCMILVLKTPPCGHEQLLPCSISLENFKCQMRCERILACGHRCGNKCFEPCSDNSCREKVEKLLLCGHTVKIECSADIYKQICQSPCSKTLGCGHKCKGDCYKCFNETLHVRCREKCKRILICGHECQSKCGESCSPCEKKCNYQCCKAKCPLSCGEKCIPCKSPCEYQCPHSKCTLMCQEVCNRKCDLPCQKKNKKCQHPCIGICGEICPEICRICQKKNEIFEIFFGEEDNENAMFYQLQCGHIFEVSGLDQYMSKENEKTQSSGAIKYIGCPKCKTTITKSNRYQNYIKATLWDINQIKDRINMANYVSKEDLEQLNKNCSERVKAIEIDKELLQLMEVARRVRNFISEIPKEVANFVNQKKNFKKKDYESLQNHINLFETYIRLLLYTLKNIVTEKSYEVLLFKSHVISLGKSYLFEYDSRFDDLMWVEIKRKLDSLVFYKEYDILGRMKPSNSIKICKSKICSTKFYLNDEELKFYKNQLEALNIPTREEQIKIAKALNMTAGHFFKCPNGHYYVIGECGGAMEQGKCIECKSIVGGGQHALAAGNRHTGDLDGSSHAAYSEGAQLELIRRLQNERRFN